MTQQSGSQQDSNLTGKTIGPYELQQEIGRGGMATVYSGRQLSMNRMVAIKVLPRHFLHDPGFLERFEREVEVISKLEHPHILPIYDYGETEGVPYIAMRYLGGGSMADLIRRGVPELKDIVQPMRQVAEALDYAHQRGIIHRDLKPGNIMLDESGNAYLSDFGIARVMGSDLTGSAIIGTPAYMSPEQAHGAPIDARSDIYSLGIVLFELITGHEPYHAETPMGLLLMHINEPIPPLTKFRDDVPPSLQHVVERATAKDPDQRYSSAGELAESLAAAVRGEAVTPAPMAPISYPPPPTQHTPPPTGYGYATNPPTAPGTNPGTVPPSQQFYG
ncbi:MAG: serine/threonine protein kinase, partial [Anaerolineae bacterium]|nr:serine/threonine protein kinase [Anaerolineae bacterium]